MAVERPIKVERTNVPIWADVLQTRFGSASRFEGTFDPEPYRLDPLRYIRDKLGWEPWAGQDGHPGQVEIIDAYRIAICKQMERLAIGNGEDITPIFYKPGEMIRNWIRVESANNTGKTRCASGLVNHFFDCFAPSITYSFAPSWAQVHDLLWKEIKATRANKGLPGRVLDLRLERSDEHFALGKATSDAGGAGLERAQGQHAPYLLMVLDEAEGVAEYIYRAVDNMTSGGVVIVLLLANPKTRSSEFYKRRTRDNVINFRLNSIYHPNVVENREIIPGAIRRDAINLALKEHCQVVSHPDPDKFTFEVPWQPGIIYIPDEIFCCSVLGMPPPDAAERILIPRGRFEEACKRSHFAIPEDELKWARVGVDVARDGTDLGTIYCRWAGKIWRHARLSRLDTNQYAGAVKELAQEMAKSGVESFHVRIDAGGGYGGGVADRISEDEEISEMFKTFGVDLVHFGWKALDERQFADRITELYADAAESIKGVKIEDPGIELEVDLCDRRYIWINRAGRELRKLESKDLFRNRMSRSPDDGDGFVLAIASDRMVSHEWFWM